MRPHLGNHHPHLHSTRRQVLCVNQEEDEDNEALRGLMESSACGYEVAARDEWSEDVWYTWQADSDDSSNTRGTDDDSSGDG